MVSTKGRYALRVMIDLAEHNNGELIRLNDIAARQQISEKYLEGIMVLLAKAGLVFSSRGKGGGYRLIKQPYEYKAGEIIRAIEGSLAPVACLSCTENTCKRASFCKTLPFWSGLKNAIDEYVDKYTLEDLTDNQNNYTV